MKSGGKKKVKRKPVARMSFGELVRKLWQPESEDPELKIATKKRRRSAAKGKRISKGISLLEFRRSVVAAGATLARKTAPYKVQFQTWLGGRWRTRPSSSS